MPFKPELNYFFIYIKRHLEETHSITCNRGDNDVLTVPILEKINEAINKADVLIADCTGRNPNVFYELGIAHTLNKKVILITMDDVKEAPTDIKHFEFIKYDLVDNEHFISKLDNAIRNIFFEHYEILYQKALEIFSQFLDATKLNILPRSKEVFISKIMFNEKSTPIPNFKEEAKLRRVLLPAIIELGVDLFVMEKASKWLTSD
jgi:hypothetical protein